MVYYALPDNLARKLGENMARMVTDFPGNGVLMYSSDYLHAESCFPESTNKVPIGNPSEPRSLEKCCETT
jgi:hypothetical protein